jgi:methionyl-tRNA formyltransferase
MRILFMGTPFFAVASLQAALEVGEVVAVITQPDKPKGRGQQLALPPVKVLAQAHGVAVLQPPKVRNDPGLLEQLRALAPDVCVVSAYGKILPPELLQLPRRGCVNVHASLLPRWRGAAPIQWALAAGDERTGVCLMQMDEGLDTGAVISCVQTPIGPDDTSQTLHDRLSALGGTLLRRDLSAWVRGELEARAQPEQGVTWAPMIKKEDGRLDFGRPASELERKVRAFTPWPGGFTLLSGQLLKVHRVRVGQRSGPPGTVLTASAEGVEVACAEGSLWLEELQPEGKKRMTAAQFLAGRRLEPGTSPFEERT